MLPSPGQVYDSQMISRDVYIKCGCIRSNKSSVASGTRKASGDGVGTEGWDVSMRRGTLT